MKSLFYIFLFLTICSCNKETATTFSPKKSSDLDFVINIPEDVSETNYLNKSSTYEWDDFLAFPNIKDKKYSWNIMSLCSYAGDQFKKTSQLHPGNQVVTRLYLSSLIPERLSQSLTLANDIHFKRDMPECGFKIQVLSKNKKINQIALEPKPFNFRVNPEVQTRLELNDNSILIQSSEDFKKIHYNLEDSFKFYLHLENNLSSHKTLGWSLLCDLDQANRSINFENQNTDFFRLHYSENEVKKFLSFKDHTRCHFQMKLKDQLNNVYYKRGQDFDLYFENKFITSQFRFNSIEPKPITSSELRTLSIKFSKWERRYLINYYSNACKKIKSTFKLGHLVYMPRGCTRKSGLPLSPEVELHQNITRNRFDTLMSPQHIYSEYKQFNLQKLLKERSLGDLEVQVSSSSRHPLYFKPKGHDGFHVFMNQYLPADLSLENQNGEIQNLAETTTRVFHAPVKIILNHSQNTKNRDGSELNFISQNQDFKSLTSFKLPFQFYTTELPDHYKKITYSFADTLILSLNTSVSFAKIVHRGPHNIENYLSFFIKDHSINNQFSERRSLPNESPESEQSRDFVTDIFSEEGLFLESDESPYNLAHSMKTKRSTFLPIYLNSKFNNLKVMENEGAKKAFDRVAHSAPNLGVSLSRKFNLPEGSAFSSPIFLRELKNLALGEFESKVSKTLMEGLHLDPSGDNLNPVDFEIYSNSPHTKFAVPLETNKYVEPLN